MENMCNCKRYKDIIIKNYVYYSSNNTQFGAYTLILSNNSICIVFQGTGDSIGSWKDKFEITSQSTNSNDINYAINRWLKKHSYEEIEKICNEVFLMYLRIVK